MSFYNRVISFWNLLSSFGIKEEHGLRELRRIKFLNRFAFMANLLVLFNLFLSYSSDYFQPTVYLSVVFFALNVGIIYLNHKGKSTYSGLIYSILLPILFLISSILAKAIIGRPFGIEEYVIPRLNLTISIVFTYILIDNRSKALFYSVLLFNFICILGFDFIHGFFGVGIASLEGVAYDSVQINSLTLVSAVMITILMSFLTHIVNKYETENNKLISELRNSKGVLEEMVSNRTFELNESNSQLSEKLETIEHYSQVISHNLRGPVTTLKGLMMIYNKKIAPQENKDVMMNMEVTMDRILEVIQNLADILSLQNKTDGKKESVCVDQLLKEVENELAALYNDEEFRIEHNISGKSIVVVREYMKIILKNLFSNSIKFRNPNLKCVIEVELRENSLLIHDNGIGFDVKKHQKNLFKLYKKFHGNSAGLGTGLFFSKLLVEQMGMKINLDSKLNKGTMISIDLGEA